MATSKRNKLNPRNIGLLMFKFIRGELTPSQEKTLTAWRRLSPVNEKTFREAIDPERIRKEMIMLFESSAWRKLQKKYPEIPRVSNN